MYKASTAMGYFVLYYFFIVVWRGKYKVLILDFFSFLTDTWDSEMSGARLAIVPSQTLAIILSHRKGAMVTFHPRI